ncbi:MAG: hypothetical protein ACE5FT_06210 [Candidatus Nanoarchaeia archaeon]
MALMVYSQKLDDKQEFVIEGAPLSNIRINITKRVDALELTARICSYTRLDEFGSLLFMYHCNHANIPMYSHTVESLKKILPAQVRRESGMLRLITRHGHHMPYIRPSKESEPNYESSLVPTSGWDVSPLTVDDRMMLEQCQIQYFNGVEKILHSAVNATLTIDGVVLDETTPTPNEVSWTDLTPEELLKIADG